MNGFDWVGFGQFVAQVGVGPALVFFLILKLNGNLSDVRDTMKELSSEVRELRSSIAELKGYISALHDPRQ